MMRRPVGLRVIGQLPLADRFEASYVPEPNSGCWLWLGSLMGQRGRQYPVINIEGKRRRANRVSIELHKGPIPAGLLACHTCNNILCVNPDHLYPGTTKQNADDMVRAGRNKFENLKEVWAERRARRHCFRGHAFADGDFSINKKGQRVCLACRRITRRNLQETRSCRPIAP